MRLAALLVSSLLVSSLGCALPAAADRLHYDVFVGGVKAVSLTAEVGFDGTRYAAGITAKTEGVTDWLLGWRLSAFSEGERGMDGMTPALHRSVSRFRGENRSVDIRFDQGRLTGWSVTPPEENDSDRVPVTREEALGALDAISGILGAMLESRDGSCPNPARIFDGRRRFNLIFTDKGTQVLKPSDYGLYKGEAMACEFRLERIAGYLKRPTDWNRPEDRDRPTLVFSQSVLPSLPPVPVRLESDLTLGAVVVHLVRVEETSAWPKPVPLPAS
jgi:hypothetical protein